MLLPASHVLSNLASEYARATQSAASTLSGSASQSTDMALRLLIARQRGGAAALHAQLTGLTELLFGLAAQLPPDGVWQVPLDRITARVQSLRTDTNLDALETGWRELLVDAEHFVVAAQAGALSKTQGAAIRRALTAWEIGDLQAQAPALPNSSDSHSTALTAERLTAYLRERFRDSALAVSGVQELSGGFGKQTFLFTAQGAALQGDFVLRRDMAVPMFDNDCHRIHKEYAVIRAAHALGFPAPEALWLDVEHRTLPGGDFLVMRRAPGTAGGNVFRAQGAIPGDLAQTLAEILARLHRLPAMPELAQLTDSIASELWDLPLEHCVRRYLENWLALFQREPHLSSPAIISQFGWLLDNIPPMPGKPVLLHGDIGFHNFLFDEGRLTAVLDWEFAHLGDPAEDLAYVRNTLGASLDWNDFLARYQAAGGVAVEESRIHFFQIWGHLRNAAASSLVSAKFANGLVGDLKLVLLPHAYVPQFLSAAQSLIEQAP